MGIPTPSTLLLLLCLCLLTSPPLVAASPASLYALDGFGRPVAWWAVLKLPMLVQNASSPGSLRPTPCDCPPPDCANVHPPPSTTQEERATGLCYLYADAHTPALRYFRELGYDCLGQGGNDPVSHTLRQREVHADAYWATFNDQLNGIAQPFEADIEAHSVPKNATTCGGGDLFSAHAKGAVALDASQTGGFYLQASTPSFPDPSNILPVHSNGRTHGETDAFVRLGCQKDNNVRFAQHFAAFSLEADAIETLGGALSVARLCSGNFYHGELGRALASDALWRDGAAPDAKGAVAALYHALLDPNSTDGGHKDSDGNFTRRVTLPLRRLDPLSVRQPTASKSVFSPLSRPDDFLPEINDKLAGESTSYSTAAHEDTDQATTPASEEDTQVDVLVKGPHAAVPPWVLLAASLESDVSVASWWDDGYGIPSICAGDSFASTPLHFCLEEPRAGATLLPPDARARFNVENLIQATWKLRDGSDNLTWHLVGGGRARDGNHAKWGVTTPRHSNAASDVDGGVVTFGDLNMEGFPCSKACNGSQAGRGGSFFSLHQPELHQSLTQDLIMQACKCGPPPPLIQSAPPNWIGAVDPDVAAFETLRMCHHGCIKKFEERWQGPDLPVLSANASSFWPS